VPATTGVWWWSTMRRARPVGGAFVTVTVQQDSDGVGAAELFGQDLQAGAGNEDPPAGAGFHEVPRGEGFQRLVHRSTGQPGPG
jgi:hypothetical protein